MQQDAIYSQLIELNREIDSRDGVHFDAESVVLIGSYSDELSAFRARRAWVAAFESSFLLDKGHDYELHMLAKAEEHRFYLSCQFLTACGRYAFWRLVNEQVPEVQYLIETAHIASGASRQAEIAAAPDLGDVTPAILGGSLGMRDPESKRSIISRLFTQLKSLF